MTTAVRLQDDRKAELAAIDRRARLVRRLAHAIARRRNAVTRHEAFRECLAAFELRGHARRTENAPSFHTKSIDDAAIERQLGADDGEIDRLTFGEREQRIGIGRIDRDGLRDCRDAGVARRADDRGDGRVAAEAPGECVFAPAAAGNQNPHKWPNPFSWNLLQKLDSSRGLRLVITGTCDSLTYSDGSKRPYRGDTMVPRARGDRSRPRGVYSSLAEVKVQDGESIESALRRFKRKVQQEDIIKDIKKHSFYLKPGDRRRAKQALARKRTRKKQRRESD